MADDMTWAYIRFYEGIEKDLARYGFVDLQWMCTKATVVRTLNWLRFKKDLRCSQRLKLGDDGWPIADLYVIRIEIKNP